MSTLFNKSNSSNKFSKFPKDVTPSTNAPTVSLSQNGRYVLLSDDIVYVILMAAAKVKSELDRRETLFALCRVCRVWSRAAQSLLFRHVFIQIRSSMMALLKVVDHRTERGRRLAGYIQAATIKPSKYPESRDPPALPMIHPRHIPALLCHMPNLCTLDLTTGWELFSPEIITAISRGPQITALTLGNHNATSMDSPAPQMLINNDTNPWPLLESFTVQHTDRSVLAHIPEGLTPPKMRLTQVAIYYQSGGSFEELHWLTQYSKETLTHVSLVSGAYSGPTSYLGHPNIKNVQSLTLGHTIWTEDLLGTLHTFNNLKELRLVSFIQLQRPFPSNLPDTIEYLLITTPFMPVPIMQGLDPVTPDMARPSLLKGFTAIVVGRPAYTHGIHLYMMGDMWVKEYARHCESHGIMTEICRTDGRGPGVVSKSPFAFKPSGSDVSLRIHQSNGKFKPTPSQLDLTDFHVILGGRKVTREFVSNGSTAWASSLTRSGKTALAPFTSIRGLVSSWTGTKRTEHH